MVSAPRRSEHRLPSDNGAKTHRPGLIRYSLEDVMPTNDEIFEKVQSTLVDALGVDEDDVTPDATLFKDLGAESIDLLDIVFRLERNFGIKIPRGELFPENVSDPELAQNGKLTPKGLTEMKQRMPYADLSGFEANPEVDKLLDLYTVDMLVQYVSSKLSAGAA
jgi:acyl carrier protein